MDFSTLDKQSSEQLYLQIRRILLKAIRQQELTAGQKLPSAAVLSESMAVSRMTVRQALQTLINEGWLYTVPGKGTFVANSPHIEQNLQTLMGWTEEILAQGMRPSTRLISVDVLPADRLVARVLGISVGARLFQVVRLRLADDFPLSVERAHLAYDRFPGLDVYIRREQSLYQVLRQFYQVYPIRAVQFLEAGELDRHSAELLDVLPGQPALLSERISYTAEDQAVEYVTGVARPGFVRFRTELSAGSQAMRQVVRHGATEGAVS
jgi:GntR family transcriptional regulator